MARPMGDGARLAEAVLAASNVEARVGVVDARPLQLDHGGLNEERHYSVETAGDRTLSSSTARPVGGERARAPAAFLPQPRPEQQPQYDHALPCPSGGTAVRRAGICRGPVALAVGP